MTKRKREWFNSVGLLIMSTLVALLLAEALCRIVLDPIDYLLPELMNDDVLGVKIRPGSAGHDAWGLRNKVLPGQADVVAIGDSQTYGVSAAARYSWPSWFAEVSGQRVYNMSLGGYSPIEYFYLFQTKALQLKPKVVIVGFYFGNDLLETYRSVYSREVWKEWRKPEFVPAQEIEQKNTETVRRGGRLLGGMRTWLSERSIFYRVFSMFVSGQVKGLLSKGKRNPQANEQIVLNGLNGGFTVFTPGKRLGAINLKDASIQEGLRITIDAMESMDAVCRKKGIIFRVLLIPTKEHVYADLIEHQAHLDGRGVIEELLANEREVSKIIKRELTARGINYLEVLAPMQKALGEGRQLYPPFDGHPNKAGYEIIAREVFKAMKLHLN